MKKLTDLQKLKYWLDVEFTILHIMFYIVMWQLTSSWFLHLILGVFMFYSALYMIVRVAVIAADDPDYLRVPKR